MSDGCSGGIVKGEQSPCCLGATCVCRGASEGQTERLLRAHGAGGAFTGL